MTPLFRAKSIWIIGRLLDSTRAWRNEGRHERGTFQRQAVQEASTLSKPSRALFPEKLEPLFEPMRFKVAVYIE